MSSFGFSVGSANRPLGGRMPLAPGISLFSFISTPLLALAPENQSLTVCVRFQLSHCTSASAIVEKFTDATGVELNCSEPVVDDVDHGAVKRSASNCCVRAWHEFVATGR